MPTFRFAGMNTLADPTSISLESGQSVDICNFWLDDEHNATVRDGYTRVLPGHLTAAWQKDESGAYVVEDNILKWFDGITTTPCLTLVDTVFMLVAFPPGPVDFCAVNDIVVVSNGSFIGVIDGTDVIRLDRATEWSEVLNLESWVKDHYPADYQATAGNFAVNAFRLAALPGLCLEFFNGALYLARDNFVFCTETFDIEQMDLRANVVAGFPDPITMIAGVTDGLYVGTTKGVYFLSGGGFTFDAQGTVSGGFTQRLIAPAGVLPNTLVKIAPSLLPLVKAQETVVVWSSPLGVFSGTSGGSVRCLAEGKVLFPLAGSPGIWPRCAAQFFGKDGVYQYVVSIQGAAWVMNTNSLTFARYECYDFTGFCTIGNNRYGVGPHGIYLLAGTHDFTGEVGQQVIDAFILTPVSDFGIAQKKSLEALYVVGRINGDLDLGIAVNEVSVPGFVTIHGDHQPGNHRIRGKPPKGLAGTCWQFRVKNKNGNRITAKELEVSIVKHNRR